MKTTKATAFAALFTASALLAAGAANARGGISVTPRVSTLGLGLEVKYQFHEKFNGRVVFNQYDKSYSKTSSGNKYEGDLELSSYGLIGDWHPFGNGFRLSAGLYSNSNEIKARTAGGQFTYQGNDYMGNANATVDFKSTAPYLGLGWSSQKERGFSFDFEVGTFFHGAPQLSARGSATHLNVRCSFSVNDNGVATVTREGGAGDCARDTTDEQFKDDLEAEHRELKDDFDEFKVYPVVSLGVQYRF